MVALGLLWLSVDFGRRFAHKSRTLRQELDKALKELTAIRNEKKGELVELSRVAERAMHSGALANLWDEYAKTLHKQLGEEDELGQQRIKYWRSTALAETFFTDQAIVDSRLKTDYFKHLPGLLTGLGIIGTFFGLIQGLMNFNVSVEPAAAQAQLQGLIQSVGHAFRVSAIAIGLAMLFTWFEKTSVTARYGQAEKLRGLIDGLFKGGAGEEYLQGIAQSCEDAATHIKHLRDTLVVDLKEVLTTLTDRQIQAQAQHTGQMSGDVAKVISDSMAGPISTLTEAVRKVSGSQGDAVNKLLTDVLASFASQMQEMFGGQMKGMTDLLHKASVSMQATADQFGLLAANMDDAGTNTVAAMGKKLTQALDAMDARQSAMNSRMGEFVEQIRALVAGSQSETGKSLREALAAVGAQVAGVVEKLRQQAEAADESQGQRSQRFEESTGQAINSLSGQVERLLAQSMETSKSLQTSVVTLAGATDRAMAGLSSGIDTLHEAVAEFAKAGSGVSETMRSATTATESIKAASTQLATATENAKGVFADYGRTRDAFATMVAELRQTFDSAKKDAAMTSELIGKIQAATRELAAAQQQSGDYLEGVTQVLVGAHESFRDNLEKTLGEGNRKFQGELSSAVGHLSTAIMNLGDVVEDIPTTGRR